MCIKCAVIYRDTIYKNTFQAKAVRPEIGGDRQSQGFKAFASVVRIEDRFVDGDEMSVIVESGIKFVNRARGKRIRSWRQ